MKTDGFSRGRGESVFYFICGGGGEMIINVDLRYILQLVTYSKAISSKNSLLDVFMSLNLTQVSCLGMNMGLC